MVTPSHKRRPAGRHIAMMLLSGVLSISPSSGFADLAAGVDAFNTGNYTKAALEFTIAANKGDVHAQVNLGLLYENGLGVEYDPSTAFQWYKRAAEAGSTLAQFNLAALYFEGVGVEQSYELAAQWYRLAASYGEAIAQYNLAAMFDEGLGVELDVVQAWAWQELAIHNGLDVSSMERDALTEKLTESELVQAQSLFNHYQQRYPSNQKE